MNVPPVAMLVIYDSGFKFKYKKYYLRKGINLIGSSPKCEIVIADGERIPERVAILNITDDLATIQAVSPSSLHVLSNMKRKNNVMVEIEPNAKYVI